MKLDGIDLDQFVKLPTNPRPAPRARVGKGRGYNASWYTKLKLDWATVARTQINQRGLPTFFNGQRLKVNIVFFRHSTKDKNPDKSDGDGDNMAKTLTDALEGEWYENDRQIDVWNLYVVRQIPKVDAYALVWVEELPADSVIDKLRQWWRDRRE